MPLDHYVTLGVWLRHRERRETVLRWSSKSRCGVAAAVIPLSSHSPARYSP